MFHWYNIFYPFYAVMNNTNYTNLCYDSSGTKIGRNFKRCQSSGVFQGLKIRLVAFYAMQKAGGDRVKL